MKDFDNSQEGGRLLNEDLQSLSRKHGQDHICMAITFPEDYPTHPFFVRWGCLIGVDCKQRLPKPARY